MYIWFVPKTFNTTCNTKVMMAKHHLQRMAFSHKILACFATTLRPSFPFVLSVLANSRAMMNVKLITIDNISVVQL